MKQVLYIMILLLNSQGSCEQKSLPEVAITYAARTRGFTYEITVDKKIITYTNSAVNIAEQQIILDNENLQSLKIMVDTIDLNTLSLLEAPSSDSYTDRSAIATLSIATDGGTAYESSQFDHGTPPKELEEIITYLQFLTDD